MPVGRRARIDMGFVKNSGIDLTGSIFLGQGRYGRVFLLPGGRVIKIFKDEESCIHEYTILQSVRSSRHFPRVYECRGNYMIRDFVGGICLPDYLKEHKLSRRLALNLIELIEDFKRLGFTRLDIRGSHIFVQPNESVIVIDPRMHYNMDVPYPKSMLGKLKKLRALKSFMQVLKRERPLIYNRWKKSI